MVMPKASKYEELRRRRLEENKKRMEELHLSHLSSALKNASPLKSSPMKKASSPREKRTLLVPLRRSGRISSNPAPLYKEVTVLERIRLPRRVVHPRMDLFNRVYASDESRAAATVKAEELESTLGSVYPTLVRPMLPSHVTGGFWLGLPSFFCKRNLPKQDVTMTLVDEEGEEWSTIYLARKAGLSGGWKKFAVDHHLVDGDAVVFQLVQRTVLKVYIIRVNDLAKNDNPEA